MSDQRQREAERRWAATGAVQDLDQVIAEQLRTGEGRFARLTALFEELRRVQLPYLAPHSLHAAGALRRDLVRRFGVSAEDVPALLDALVVHVLPEAIGDAALVFVALGREESETGAGSQEEEEEDDYVRPDLEQPWREQDLPLDGADGSPLAEPRSIREALERGVDWSINNKLYPLADGRVVAFGKTLEEDAQVAAREAEHQAARRELVARLLHELDPDVRLWTGVHAVTAESAQLHHDGLCRDELFALVDADHVRVVWVLHDRCYG